MARQESTQLVKAINGAARYAIPRRTPGDPCPLSFSQQRLWFLDQLSPGDSTYNISYAMNIEGRLDPCALQRALDAVVARHEVLRTVFKNVQGTPVPVVLEACRVSLVQVDLRGLPEANKEAEVKRPLGQEVNRGFALARDCMLRGLLIRVEEERWTFLHVSHHIAWEFGSTTLLYSDLQHFYARHANGEALELPDLPIQYSDFALWQRRFLQGDMLERLSEYWKKQLADAPQELNLPTDFPRPATLSGRGKRFPVALPGELLESARALSLRNGVTPFTGLFAGFSIFLYCYSGQEDLCVGSPIARRLREEIEPLIGFFVNTLVLRAQVSGSRSFSEMLSQMSRTVLGAIAHADLPFDTLVEIMRPARKPGRMPLFQVNFRVVKEPVPALRLPGLKVSAAEWIDNHTSKFDLSLELVATGGAPGFFEYSTDLFRDETVTRMATDFKELMSALIAEPDLPIAEIAAVRAIRARALSAS